MTTDNNSQLPHDDEPMTWESTPTPDPLVAAIMTHSKAHEEALLPHGSIHVALAMLDVQLAQAFELRRIADALDVQLAQAFDLRRIAAALERARW